jgi:magnesium transporter
MISVRPSQITARQNEIVKQLTIVATVFLPLGFVVGLFGQNFGWLVDHIDSLGAFLALGVGGLVVPCVALYFWFARSGVFGSEPAATPRRASR